MVKLKRNNVQFNDFTNPDEHWREYINDSENLDNVPLQKPIKLSTSNIPRFTLNGIDHDLEDDLDEDHLKQRKLSDANIPYFIPFIQRGLDVGMKINWEY